MTVGGGDWSHLEMGEGKPSGDDPGFGLNPLFNGKEQFRSGRVDREGNLTRIRMWFACPGENDSASVLRREPSLGDHEHANRLPIFGLLRLIKDHHDRPTPSNIDSKQAGARLPSPSIPVDQQFEEKLTTTRCRRSLSNLVAFPA
jgi:hypothetical protein